MANQKKSRMVGKVGWKEGDNPADPETIKAIIDKPDTEVWVIDQTAYEDGSQMVNIRIRFTPPI